MGLIDYYFVHHQHLPLIFYNNGTAQCESLVNSTFDTIDLP